MSLSRWKMMAGVLGVSIGGLAAAASQCPKLDKSKGRAPEMPVAKADVKLPPAGPASAPAVPPAPELPAIPPPSSAPAIPAAPQLTPAGSTAPAIPPAPTVELPKPADVAPPALPSIPAATKPTEPKPTEPKPATVLPGLPLEDLIPPAPTPPTGKPTATAPKATAIESPLITTTPVPAPPTVIGIGATQPANPGTPVASPPSPPVGLPEVPPMRAEVPPPPPFVPQPAPPAPAATEESKFRIILRVGDGTPMFEVKNGDNLVLKVACEKVDIKSPEKGGGLSEVTARGKVRFVGFGAEGTCDELKFMAGTGEVQMTGDVKVQVKDKLGRVESELSTSTMKYKIDASSVGGTIKP